MLTEVLVGTKIRLPVTVTNYLTHALADPDSVILKIRKPDKSLVTLTYGIDAALIKSGPGEYYADVIFDQVGHWHWRYDASNPAEGSLRVLDSLVL